jgi:hypothetical protein
VVEQGRHADLLAAGGRYWSLLSRQQLEESIEEEPGSNGEGGGPGPDAEGRVTELADAIPRGTLNA